MTTRDLYQSVTDRIAAALEQGATPWVQPWSESALLPTNAITGKPYRGVNRLVLWAASMDAPSAWLTFRQARALGGHVRRGQHGIPIVFWDVRELEDGEGALREAVLARSYTVFHWTQIEAVPCDALLRHVAPRSAPDAWQRTADVESLIASSGADIRTGDAAAFIPSTDCITMLAA